MMPKLGARPPKRCSVSSMSPRSPDLPCSAARVFSFLSPPRLGLRPTDMRLRLLAGDADLIMVDLMLGPTTRMAAPSARTAAAATRPLFCGFMVLRAV